MMSHENANEIGQQRRLTRFLGVTSVLFLVSGAYLLVCRPYQLHWGATAAEIERSMAGDELNQNPSFLATRAITIHGSPDQIWPWLLQMGYGRAGYYGYDILENLASPQGLRSADKILPKFQNFRPGDEMPISPVATMTFHTIEPNSHIIWLANNAPNSDAFTWALYPLDKDRTRLVSRIRWTYHPTHLGTFTLQLFTEFADHVAVRKVLQGVKQRVERNIEPMWIQNIEFFTFVFTFFAFTSSLALLCRRHLTWMTWASSLFAGGTWLVNWYAPIANWMSMLLALFAVVVLYRTHHTHMREKAINRDEKKLKER